MQLIPTENPAIAKLVSDGVAPITVTGTEAIRLALFFRTGKNHV